MGSLYVRHELLRHEYIRMITMMNLNIPDVDRKIISKSGFYYDSNHDTYFCFSCQYSIDKKTEASIFIKLHMKNWPNCLYLNDRDLSINYNPKSYFKNSPKFPDFNYYSRNVDMKKVLTNFNLQNPSVIFLRDRNFDDMKIMFYLSLPFFIPSGSNSLEILDIEEFFLSMRDESRRIQTFKVKNYCFPLDTEISNLSDSLARNGFFYCLSGTNIQCAFCRVIIGDIDYNCDVKSIHRIVSGACPIAKGDFTLNIPILKKIPRIKTRIVQETNPVKQDMTCIICFENPINVIFHCGHLSYCNNCAKKLTHCAICRKKLSGYRRVYF